MVRVAVRRSPSKKRGYSVSSRSATARKTATKSRKSTKASTAKATFVTPVFVPRIKTLLSSMQTYARQRKQKFGASDPVAKRVLGLHTAISRELRKANVVNPSMTKSLHQINTSLRGVSNVPQAIRMNGPKLLKFIKECVQKDCMKFLVAIKKFITPFNAEFKKLEREFQAQIKRAKTGKIQWKVDPSYKKRFQSLYTDFKKFKTFWGLRLNKMALHGNQYVKNSVKAIKKELDMIEKGIKRNLTIINRYAKAVKPRAGWKTQQLFTASQLNNCETKWKNIYKECDQFRANVEHYFDQLKAVKPY